MIASGAVRSIEHAYFKTPVSATRQKQVALEAPRQMLLPLWLLVAGNFYFGLDTSFSLGFASTAIQTLFH